MTSRPLLLRACLRFAGTLSPQVVPLTLQLLGVCRLVHPDKLPPGIDVRQEVKAKHIHAALQSAYEEFKR